MEIIPKRPPNEPNEKICKICKIMQPIDNYYRTGNRRRSDLLPITSTMCKKCYTNRYYYETREQKKNNYKRIYIMKDVNIKEIHDKFNHPFTMLINALSKSGKTTFLIKLIQEIEQYYDLIIFFSMSYNNDIYNPLKESKTLKDKMLTFDSRAELILSAIFKIQQENSNKFKLLILFDDFATRKNKYSEGVEKLFIMGRNSNLSTIYTGQDFRLFSTILRSNAHYSVIFNQRLFNSIVENYNLFLKGIINNYYSFKSKRKDEKELEISQWIKEITKDYKPLFVDYMKDEITRIVD